MSGSQEADDKLSNSPVFAAQEALFREQGAVIYVMKSLARSMAAATIFGVAGHVLIAPGLPFMILSTVGFGALLLLLSRPVPAPNRVDFPAQTRPCPLPLPLPRFLATNSHNIRILYHLIIFFLRILSFLLIFIAAGMRYTWRTESARVQVTDREAPEVLDHYLYQVLPPSLFRSLTLSPCSSRGLIQWVHRAALSFYNSLTPSTLAFSRSSFPPLSSLLTFSPD